MQLFAFGTTWRCADYIKISNILMQLLAFGTTSRRADYIKISNQSDQKCCQQNSSNLQKLCPPYLTNGFSQPKNFLYSLLMLPNLALIKFLDAIG
ncbi:hypothetical protein O3M35_005672 [Rhynocoris fuscipes]|uniref:Uncharacterized protein n=1 Tax=Rhynocoris fuscipes TaxID=488301 RepID=A0AAW1DL18_9HEMI